MRTVPFIDDLSECFTDKRKLVAPIKLCEAVVEKRMSCGVPAKYRRDGRPVCWKHADPDTRIVFFKVPK